MSAPVTRVVRRVVKKESGAPRPAATDTPYAGVIDLATGGIVTDRDNRGLGDGDVARVGPHLMVAGGTGEGKSRRVLVPNILRWGRSRPVVSLSSKGDVAELTIRKRSQCGEVYLLDLSGEVRESELQGVDVTRVKVDPCALISTDDEALKMADLLQEISSPGEGDAKFWKNLSRRRLACFLRAGGWYPHPSTGEPTWGGGVAWAVDACEDAGRESTPSLDDENVDVSSPNWDSAYLRVLLQGSKHAKSLLSAKAMDPKQRDSIGMNSQDALNQWAMSNVAGNPEDKAFRPDMLTGGATLYIVAPMEGAASAVAALLVKVVDYWRLRVGDLPPILFVLDEFTNGTKLPAQRVIGWVGEGRGLGIRLVLALQDSSQLEELWGQAAAKVMRKIVPAFLVMPGADEDEALGAAARMMPVEERVTANVGADGRVSQGRERMEADAASLAPVEKGEARLLIRGRAGVKVSLPDVAQTDLLD